MIFLINLIFQSGEFYDQGDSFFKDFIIQSLSIFTALFVFWLGVKANERSKRKDYDESMDQKYNYFNAIIGSIVSLTIEQSTLLATFIHQLKEDIIVVPIPASVPVKDLERFADMHDHERYYHAYLHKHGSNEQTVINFRAFYTSIDFLYLSNNLIFQRINEAREFDHDRKVKYNAIFKNVSNAAAELVRRNSISEQKDEFAEFLNQSLMTYIGKRIDPKNLNEIQELFVLPVLHKVVNDYRHIDDAAKLAIDLKEANQIYELIRHNNQALLVDIQGKIARFNERIKVLESLPR